MKSLLVAAALCVGGNAWADDITAIPSSFTYSEGGTIAPFDANVEIKTKTDIASALVSTERNTTSTAWFDTDAETDGKQPYTIAANEKVSAEFTVYLGWQPKGNYQAIAFQNDGGVTLASFTYNNSSTNVTDVQIGGATPDGFAAISGLKPTGNGFDNWSSVPSPVKVTISISGSGSVVLNFVSESNSISTSVVGSLPAGTALNLAKLTYYHYSYNDKEFNNNRSMSIKGISLTTETVSEANITYKYEDTEGNDLSSIASDKVASANIGATIDEELIPSTYKADFFDAETEAEATAKYVYSTFVCSDATVPSEGTTVTLKFAKNTKVTYTLDCVDKDDNSVIIKNYTSYGYSNETKVQYYPKGINYNGSWYIAAQGAGEAGNYYGKTLNANTPATVQFTKRTDIEAYYEAESITFRSKSPTTLSDYPNRYSDAKAITIAGGAIFVGTVSGGVYNIHVGGRGRANSAGTLDLFYGVRNDNYSLKETTALGELTWGSGATGEMTLVNVYIPASQYVAFNMASANIALDYVYFEKVTSVSPTIGSTGYATYASDYALDFSAATGVKAYKATAAADGKVTMAEVTGTAAAGEGLFLQKTTGEISIPVVATGDALTGNLLVRGTGAEVAKEDGFNKYVLGAEDESVAFFLINAKAATVAKDKAYLKVAADAAPARLAIVFEDSETTGIATVENANVLNENYYNLNGQRIVAPQKGLYIVNGKKVVLK